ncbi:tyrosine-type recombinase/integrase [Helicobacter cetorum]|uniref:Bacteriophage-related integrase n=1 Tax=Helicobacter cetorum (strain ATCC BAA-429 / MIT 00-7128) TaxID=182217 RepID=I0ELK3_HELC0|nr:site-specific integrase [Helicobacter cetorum]AFI03822.1 bacteriophage-related integrase [Helicobacter cetorum MIT 00-7128]
MTIYNRNGLLYANIVLNNKRKRLSLGLLDTKENRLIALEMLESGNILKPKYKRLKTLKQEVLKEQLQASSTTIKGAKTPLNSPKKGALKSKNKKVLTIIEEPIKMRQQNDKRDKTLQNETLSETDKKITIEELIKERLSYSIGLKESTLKTQQTNFKNAFKLTGIKDLSKFYVSNITKEHIKSFYQNALNKHSRLVINILKSRLKELLEFAKKEGYITQSPFFALKIRNAIEPKEIKPFSLEEIKQILNACNNFRLKTYLTTAFFTGARVGELLALTWKDIDFERNKININKNLSYKGTLSSPKTKSSIREIDMLEVVKKALLEYKESLKEERIFVFISKPQRTNEFNKAFKELLIALNLEKRVLYNTRHTFASLMLSQGEESLWVSQTLGHKNLDITFKTYAKFIPNQNKERATFLKGVF